VSSIVVTHPSIAGGEPTIGRTRIPIKSLANYVWLGIREDQLLSLFPALYYGELTVACWYTAKCGPLKYQIAWRRWVESHQSSFEAEFYETIPLPPSKSAYMFSISDLKIIKEII